MVLRVIWRWGVLVGMIAFICGVVVCLWGRFIVLSHVIPSSYPQWLRNFTYIIGAPIFHCAGSARVFLSRLNLPNSALLRYMGVPNGPRIKPMRWMKTWLGSVSTDQAICDWLRPFSPSTLRLMTDCGQHVATINLHNHDNSAGSIFRLLGLFGASTFSVGRYLLARRAHPADRMSSSQSPACALFGRTEELRLI